MAMPPISAAQVRRLTALAATSVTTHSRLKRKRAPALTVKTSSPTSTKPPIAVSMPRKISTHFFISQRRRLLLQALLHAHQLREEARELLPRSARGPPVAVSALGGAHVLAQPPGQVAGARHSLPQLRPELRRVELPAHGFDVLPKLGRLRLEVHGSDVA